MTVKTNIPAPELSENDLFKTLSQAIVVQGLVGLAMASWFTKSSKATQNVNVVNPNPLPVEDVS